MPDIGERKAKLREQVSRSVRALRAEERRAMDQAVVDSAMDVLGRHFLTQSVVLAYLPMPDEVDLTPILAECVERDLPLALPRVNDSGTLVLHRVQDFDKNLVRGRHGNLEPREGLETVFWSEVTLAFVPGRAFAPDGARLGRGGGHFDRALILTNALRVAPAYDCQVLESLPREPHDQTVDVIITPTRIIETARRKASGGPA